MQTNPSTNDSYSDYSSDSLGYNLRSRSRSSNTNTRTTDSDISTYGTVDYPSTPESLTPRSRTLTGTLTGSSDRTLTGSSTRTLTGSSTRTLTGSSTRTLTGSSVERSRGTLTDPSRYTFSKTFSSSERSAQHSNDEDDRFYENECEAVANECPLWFPITLIFNIIFFRLVTLNCYPFIVSIVGCNFFWFALLFHLLVMVVSYVLLTRFPNLIIPQYLLTFAMLMYMMVFSKDLPPISYYQNISNC